MKKIKMFFVVLFLPILVLCTLASCNSNEAKNLILRGYPSEFVEGEKFDSKGLLVEATIGNNNIDVTDEVEIDASKVNMDVPGVYAVVVKYMNIETAYYITVEPVPNEQRLLSLSVDTTSVKKDYLVGETFDSTGLGIIATYQNSNDDPNEVRYVTDLKDYSIVIRDSQNNPVSGAFNATGEYTIYVVRDNVRASFNVNVASERLSINDAIIAMINNKNLIKSGSSRNINPSGTSSYSNVSTNYILASNAIDITYFLNNVIYTDSISLVNGEVVGNRTGDDGSNIALSGLTNEHLSGLEYEMFSGSQNYFKVVGAENLVKKLYDLAKTNPNNDFGEGNSIISSDTGGRNYAYSFNFGLLQKPLDLANTYYFYQVSVEFGLSSNNFANLINITSNTYVLDKTVSQFKIVPKGEPDNNAFYPEGTTFPVIDQNYSISDCMALLNDDATPNTKLSCSYQIRQA